MYILAVQIVPQIDTPEGRPPDLEFIPRYSTLAQTLFAKYGQSRSTALTHNTFLAPRRAGMADNRRRTYQNNGLRGMDQAGDGAAIAAERGE